MNFLRRLLAAFRTRGLFIPQRKLNRYSPAAFQACKGWEDTE